MTVFSKNKKTTNKQTTKYSQTKQKHKENEKKTNKNERRMDTCVQKKTNGLQNYECIIENFK